METFSRYTDTQQTIERLLDRPLADLRPIHGGRNSQVFAFTAGRPLVAKVYHRDAVDGRDRLCVEFSALQFLWKNGLRCVPQPLVCDKTAACAIYSFVPGYKISGAQATACDLEQAAEFAGTLRLLRGTTGAKALPDASEARFSVAGVIENLKERAAHLKKAERTPPLSTLIDKELLPALARLAKRAETLTRAAEDIPASERTLSHSDFGFHNALRNDEGRVFFVDFEYFGWDDPAKMISDFMLQPVVGLNSAKRQTFFSLILKHFPDQPGLSKRVAAVYPLFALKWALIMLNDFVPGARERRAFSGATGDATEQLTKARALIARALQESDFPYHG